MTAREQKERPPKPFHQLRLDISEDSDFYTEFFVLVTAVGAVNNLHALYKAQRAGAMGPSEHWQQDLYRAMLVFACAGLDVFLKELVKRKLPELIKHDPEVKIRFQDYVLNKMQKEGAIQMSTLALALISDSPKEVLLAAYIDSFTNGSLQSVGQLRAISDAFALPTHTLIRAIEPQLNTAFRVRNSIIHEMDINTEWNAIRGRGSRNRQQRTYTALTKLTKDILKLGEDIFKACQAKLDKQAK